MPRPARAAVALIAVATLVLAGMLLAQPPGGGPTRLPAPAASPASPEAFASGFREHLARALTAGDALVAIGARRERNLLTVAQGQSAMNAALDETDAWLAGQAIAAEDPAVAAYRAGAAQIRAAMADAQRAFLRFDWDGVAAATRELDSGVAQLREAQALLAGSPVGSSGSAGITRLRPAALAAYRA